MYISLSIYQFKVFFPECSSLFSEQNECNIQYFFNHFYSFYFFFDVILKNLLNCVELNIRIIMFLFLILINLGA